MIQAKFFTETKSVPTGWAGTWVIKLDPSVHALTMQIPEVCSVQLLMSN